MAQTYTYDVAADFPDGKVNVGHLQVEIEASAIVTGLTRINASGGTSAFGEYTGGTLDIIFKQALSAGDKTLLDGDTTGPAGGLIAVHDNSPDGGEVSEVHIRQIDGTLGVRAKCGFKHTFPAGQADKFDIAFPYAIDLHSGDYKLDAAADPDCRLWVESPSNLDLDLLAGQDARISGAVASGAAEVQLGAVAAATLSAILTKPDGSMMVEEVYFRLASVPANETDFTDLKKARWDAATGKLMAYGGASFGLTAADGDKVFVTLRFEDGSYLFPGQYIRIADESFDATFLPANTPLRFVIDNPGGAALDARFNLIYFHD